MSRAPRSVNTIFTLGRAHMTQPYSAKPLYCVTLDDEVTEHLFRRPIRHFRADKVLQFCLVRTFYTLVLPPTTKSTRPSREACAFLPNHQRDDVDDGSQDVEHPSADVRALLEHA